MAINSPAKPYIQTEEAARAEIERMAQVRMRELLAAEVVYEIIAPVYRLAEEEKIEWDVAAKDGTFVLKVFPVLVPDPNDPKNPEGYFLPKDEILMVNGKGSTKNKAIAEWIKREKKYEVIETHPNADLLARLGPVEDTGTVATTL